MSLFNSIGRRVPGNNMRVFGPVPSDYYRLAKPVIDYTTILERSQRHNIAPTGLTVDQLTSSAGNILAAIKANDEYANLLEGVHIPFVFQRSKGETDLGLNLKNSMLPNLQRSFNERYPDAHFKAILQSNSELQGNISLDPSSHYDTFISCSENHCIVGWYFPQALQEFDVTSQRAQMTSLPPLSGAKVCLSGGMDICAALTGSPELLISSEFYTPILCMSAYVHVDKRLVLLLKAYGPHMEFWCMTQMLTKDTTQVSEQWAGGLTVFTPI